MTVQKPFSTADIVGGNVDKVAEIMTNYDRNGTNEKINFNWAISSI
jgi:hypothetical protein